MLTKKNAITATDLTHALLMVLVSLRMVRQKRQKLIPLMS
ncbi:hypothetical protein VCHENC03_2464 [Vibrio sp. HENC-03]|nr:hypothetical protein VCHENC03_2464 [Vibrio sp. HENC-03]